MPTIVLVLAALLGSADASFGWPDSIIAAARDATELPDPQRLRTLERLTARAGERALPVLVPLLSDRDPSIRLFAARRLARAGVPAAVDAATRWISSPSVPLVDRQFGLDVLRDVPVLSDAARQAVERALRDPDAAVRVSALDALERHDALPSLPAVLSALDDDSREVRLRAIRLVSDKSDPRIALPLLSRVEDADRQVRADAIRALGAHPRATPALLRLLTDASDEARTAAMDALAAMRAEAAAPAFIALARRRPVDDAARRAQLALGKLATPAAVGALIALTRTPPVSPETKAALRLAGVAAVPGLERELVSGTPGSSAVAAALLGDIGDRHASAPLCAALERRSELAPVALDALARIADPTSLPALVRAAEASDVETRRRAYTALLALRDPRAGVTLTRGPADADPHVRELSARLAAAIGATAAAPAVAALLGDGERDVRRAAAAAVAVLASPSTSLATLILEAITKPGAPPRDGEEWQAIGEGLARAVQPGDAGRLAAAWKSARGPERAALVRAHAAAHAGRSEEDSTLLAQFVDALAGDGPLPLAVADALVVSPIPSEARAAFALRFSEATPTVRARACDAIARMPDGGPWLAALMRARDEATEVRAAAAWAARGLDDGDARDALAVARDDAEEAVAANARAALARAAPGRRSQPDSWVAAGLRAPDGAPVAGRWVVVSVPNAGDVWTKTDDAGGLRLFGVPAGPVSLRVPEALLRNE